MSPCTISSKTHLRYRVQKRGFQARCHAWQVRSQVLQQNKKRLNGDLTLAFSGIRSTMDPALTFLLTRNAQQECSQNRWGKGNWLVL